MAAAVAQSTHMHAGSDMSGSSFTSRRQNAGTLPAFELPPPPINASHKYQYTVHAAPGSHTPGNLLTPPSTVGAQDVSPSPTGTVPSLSTHVQGPSQQQQQPQYSNGYASWSPSPSHQPTYYSQQGPASYQHSRLPYSPAPTVMRGSNPHSPNTNDGAAVPSYEMSSYSASAPLTPAAVQSMSTSQAPSHHHLHPGMLGSGTPVTTAGTHPSPVHAQDGFRAPPTPTYYSQHSQPHSPFPYSNGPQQQMTLSSTGPGPMMSRPGLSPGTTGPLSALPSPALHSPAAMQGRFSPYAQMMPSMHHPSGQPMMVGSLPHGMVASFNSGHAANMQMYGSPAPAAQPQNDRPFKCDQCPQSFNRNHDLKRHKRIHLAVKPFPCGHCDKSFSRKDALKRHILVKGCGKLGEATTPAKADSVVASVSPTIKHAGSDSDDGKAPLPHQ